MAAGGVGDEIRSAVSNLQKRGQATRKRGRQEPGPSRAAEGDFVKPKTFLEALLLAYRRIRKQRALAFALPGQTPSRQFWVSAKQIEEHIGVGLRRDGLTDRDGRTLHDVISERADIEIDTSDAVPSKWLYRYIWTPAVSKINTWEDVLEALRLSDPLEPRKSTDGDAPAAAGISYDDLSLCYDGFEERAVAAAFAEEVTLVGDSEVQCDTAAETLQKAVSMLTELKAGATRAFTRITIGRGSGLRFFHRPKGPGGILGALSMWPEELQVLWTGDETVSCNDLTAAAVYKAVHEEKGVLPPPGLTDERSVLKGAKQLDKQRRRFKALKDGQHRNNAHMNNADDRFPWSIFTYDFSSPFSLEAAAKRRA
eukprot:Hpha_TRINITY_DN34507_c0_g1::TRINITY_DN34507_c0_g1_i1::g.96377::m.96377